MDISPAKLARSAPACGRFGETCEQARKHGLSPDPQAFVARYIINGTHAPQASPGKDIREGADGDRRIA